jgi:hypothetical protein
VRCHMTTCGYDTCDYVAVKSPCQTVPQNVFVLRSCDAILAITTHKSAKAMEDAVIADAGRKGWLTRQSRVKRSPMQALRLIAASKWPVAESRSCRVALPNPSHVVPSPLQNACESRRVGSRSVAKMRARVWVGLRE